VSANARFPDEFVPVRAADLTRVDVGSEAVVWSPGRPEPMALDPVATVMLGVIDGSASVAELAGEVHEEVGVPPDVARSQVERVLTLFDRAGALSTSDRYDSAAEAILQRQLHIHPVSYCIDQESRSSGVTSVNLQFGDLGVRVACASRSGARTLKVALAEHVVADEQPLGFLVQKPRGRTRVYRLTDRAGVVLATARNVKPVLGALAGHLAAFLPPPPDAIRLRVGVLASDQGFVACVPPLLFVPPPHRDRLSEFGFGLVDRFALDVTARGTASIVEIPWPQLRELPLPEGHSRRAGSPHLLGVAFPGSDGTPSQGVAVARLARTALSGSPTTVLQTLRQLVVDVGVRYERIAQDQIDKLPRLMASPR
jgi:hypothetical protein